MNVKNVGFGLAAATIAIVAVGVASGGLSMPQSTVAGRIDTVVTTLRFHITATDSATAEPKDARVWISTSPQSGGSHVLSSRNITDV